MIGCTRIFRPLVWAIELLNEPFGQKSFKVSHENNVILAVEVNPTVVAVLRVVALCLAGCRAVENLIERLAVDVAESDIKILAERHIAVAMDDEAAHDALAAQPQMSVAPLVVERHKVEVLLGVVDALGNLTDEVRSGQ